MTKAEQRVLELEQTYGVEIKKLQVSYEKKLAAARRRVGACSHPSEACTKFEWEHDNGYGRQSRQAGLRCRICKKVNHWPRISVNWYYEHELD